MTNVFLEKIAAEKKKRKAGAGVAEAGIAGIGLASTVTVPSHLLGYERVYHGTSNEGAENILKEGLRKNYGGTRGSVVTTHGPEVTQGFVDAAKKHIYVTKNKKLAETFAGDSAKYINMYGVDDPRAAEGAAKAYKSGTGKVLSARVPHQKWTRKFEMDPDSFSVFDRAVHPEATLKPHAARSRQDIPSKYFSGVRVARGCLSL